jgi:dihydroflavonol-4-reductase
MPTIAITGASGHLGSALITELLKDNNWQIRAQFNSQRPPIDHKNIDWIQSGMSPDELTVLFNNANVVIHCAAIISITGDKNGSVYATNVVGTQNVINVCLNQKIKRLIHVSSTHALQEIPLNTPFDEKRTYKTKLDFAYDYTKAKAEQLVLEAVEKSDLDAVVVRPSSMLGPVDYKPSLLGEAISDLAKRKVPAMIKGGYDFVDVRDVARSIIASIEKGVKGESYNLTGKYYAIKELAEITSQIANVKPPKFVVPSFIIQLSIPFVALQSKFTKKPPKFTKESIAVLKHGHPNMTNQKAREVLGHESRPLEDSIKDLINWKKNYK